MILLLLFLYHWTLVVCQTYPNITFMDQNLPNNSYFDFSRVGRADNGSDSIHCHTDLENCCSMTEGPHHRGDWFFPNRSRLDFHFHLSLYESRGNKLVDLRSNSGAFQPGIYRCDIATVAVHDASVRDSVYVGLYLPGEGGTYNNTELAYYSLCFYRVASSVAFHSTVVSLLNRNNPHRTAHNNNVLKLH